MNCKLCDEPVFDNDGKPIGEVFCYQKVDGKIRLAVVAVLNIPMFFLHATCINAVWVQ